MKCYEETICVTPNKEIAESYLKAMKECGNSEAILESFETDSYQKTKCFRIEGNNIELISGTVNPQTHMNNSMEFIRDDFTGEELKVFTVYAETASEAKFIAEKMDIDYIQNQIFNGGAEKE